MRRSSTSPAASTHRLARGLALPAAAAAAGLVLRASGADVPAPLTALLLAAAVVAAAFLLTWGTELAEIDIGEGLALALLALIAVLPEYAVDVVFAYKAGQDPEQYAPLALANMTGANRLLIGVGWSVVALAAIAAARRAGRPTRDVEPAAADGRAAAVRLQEVQVVEVAFLLLATAYGLTLALRRTLTLLDTSVLVLVFLAYLWRIRQIEDAEEDEEEEVSELFGAAAVIAAKPARGRRLWTVGLLAAAAAVILLVAEPFAESLVETGTDLGISQFLLVQWVAPLASETPEFIAVLLLAYKLQGAAALGALVSSKINQWTLLVGILPLVFAISTGALNGLPVGPVQREELLLTAAQSAFAVALVISGRLTTRGAWSLLGLFAVQFVLAWTLPEDLRALERVGLAVVYLVLAGVLLVQRRADLLRVLRTGLLARPDAPALSGDRRTS